MDDLFTPTEQEERKAVINFAQAEMLIEKKTAANGKPYSKIIFNLAPVLGSKYPNVTTESFFVFTKDNGNPQRSYPWDTEVLPSILALVKNKKLANVPAINETWLSWEWREWLSYSKKDVDYWKERAEKERESGDDIAAKISASRIVINEQGRVCVKKSYPHFLDVFASEDACNKAYVAYYGESTEYNVADDIPGFDDKDDAEKELKKNDEQIASFLPLFVLQFIEGKIDKTELQTTIDNTDMFKVRFESTEHHVIKNAIAKAQEGMTDSDELSKYIAAELDMPF